MKLNIKDYPLMRCLLLYKRTPIRFWISAGLFATANLMLAIQQNLIGKAIHEIQIGDAIFFDRENILHMQIACKWVFIIVAVSLGRAMILYFVGWLSLIIQQDLLGHLRESILVQVQRLDHRQHGSGEIVTRTTRDSDKLRDALISFWRQVVDTSMVVVASVGFLFWYNFWLGLVPLILTLIGFTILISQTGKLVQFDRTVGEAYDKVNQDLSEGINGVRVIKSFGLESRRVQGFKIHVDAFVNQAINAIKYSATRIPIPQFVVSLGQVWVLAFGIYLLQTNTINLGELVASLLMVNTLVFRVETVGRVMQVFADARSSAGRIWELLDAEPHITGGRMLVPAGALALRMREVTVYPADGGNCILSDCSMEIKPGEIVAVVGNTGAGKSTLSSIPVRFIDWSHGVVELAGEDGKWHNIKSFDLSSLRKAIHLVTQESFLFSDTLASNLRLANTDANDEDLIWALDMASAGELLQILSEGLQTKIGDRGITLSGGQRQRVSLARALLSKPQMLILDDSTSALDAVTERNVLTNIRNISNSLGRKTTTLVIASKLSTILLADRVLLLANGKIQDQGDHQSLLKRSSAYRELLGLENGS